MLGPPLLRWNTLALSAGDRALDGPSWQPAMSASTGMSHRISEALLFDTGFDY